MLREGERASGKEAAQILRHVIRLIQQIWPRIKICVRGGGHYGVPQVMDLLEGLGCQYIFGLPGNKRLKELSHSWCEDAYTRRATCGKEKRRRFFQDNYQAKSWSEARKIIACIEATSKGCDALFIVTNLSDRAILIMIAQRIVAQSP